MAREEHRDEHRVNERIRARTVMVIDENGTKLGVFDIRRALFMARDKGLDLVEMQANANPPVCKIMDYGRYKYELKKKQKESKKKQHVLGEKTMRLRIEIAEHDLAVKIRHIREFLTAGDKVVISIRLKGRELDHKELAHALFDRIKKETADIGKVEQEPKFEFSTFTMVLSPGPARPAKPKPATPAPREEQAQPSRSPTPAPGQPPKT